MNILDYCFKTFYYIYFKHFVHKIILSIFQLVAMIRIDTKKIYIANYDLQRFLKAINDLRRLMTMIGISEDIN